MCASLVLALALGTVEPGPVAMEVVDAPIGYHCDPCGHACKKCGCCLFCDPCLTGRSTCNMYPRCFYFPVEHGYYYFRPYNWSHIPEHQGIVAQWGGDPRNPYGADLFVRLYASLPPEYRTTTVPGVSPRLPRAPRLPNIQDLVQPKADDGPMPMRVEP